jgi:phosphomannomutase
VQVGQGGDHHPVRREVGRDEGRATGNGLGQLLRGDLLGLIVSRFLKAKVVATPVTSNSGLEQDGGFAVRRTRVGSPFVIAAMEEALS